MATDPLSNGDKVLHGIEAALASMQPLRDLARNWDIDIASLLEDYLHDVVRQLEDDDDEKKDLEPDGPPNFAQAALLLHNSSGVYSRKVEYLYSLVYAALEDLASTGGVAADKRGKTTDIAIDEFNSFDPDMNFLLLDDVLPTDQTEGGDKINLNEDDYDNGPLFNADFSRLSTRLSLGTMSATRATADRIFGSSGEAKAFIGSLFQQGDAGSLKLLNGQCDVSDKGVLVMPGTAMTGSQSSRGEEGDLKAHAPQDNGDDGGMLYDDDDGGVGFELADDNQASMGGFGTAAQPPYYQPVAQQVEQKNKEDPWALLDPHDLGPTKARPLRIGVTIRLPEGITEPPSKAVTGAHTRRRTLPTRQQVDRSAAPTVVSIATETFKATVANRRHQRTLAGMSLSKNRYTDEDDTMNDRSVFETIVARPRVPLKAQELFYGEEFAYIAKAAAKRKAVERRECRKLLAQDPTQAPVDETNFLGGFDDYDAGDDDDSIGGGKFDDNDVHMGGNTGIAPLNIVIATPDAKDTSNLEAAEFEALCRAHIKAFAKGAEKYATETNLTQRVGQWQSRLAPILEEEERRPEFNIHEYCDHVIDIVSCEIEKKKLSEFKDDKVVSFRQVTRNCQHYEVCRLFLASLNLTNAGNIAFASGSDPESLNVKLLSTRIERPMEAYMAPSATT